jgi:hypothetical protein
VNVAVRIPLLLNFPQLLDDSMKMDLKDGLKGVRCINLAQNRNDAGPYEMFMCMFGTPNNNNNNTNPNVITTFIIDDITCQLLSNMFRLCFIIFGILSGLIIIIIIVIL